MHFKEQLLYHPQYYIKHLHYKSLKYVFVECTKGTFYHFLQHPYQKELLCIQRHDKGPHYDPKTTRKEFSIERLKEIRCLFLLGCNLIGLFFQIIHVPEFFCSFRLRYQRLRDIDVKQVCKNSMVLYLVLLHLDGRNYRLLCFDTTTNTIFLLSLPPILHQDQKIFR